MIEQIEYKNHIIKTFHDEGAESPREWDNLGTMVCFHNRYVLGDKHDLNHNDFNSWEEMQEFLEKNHNADIILPLYLYDHSGITMNTRGFNCPWDSGQVGFIFISKEKIRKEYNVKRVSKKLLKKVESYLINEVKTYDDYMTGQVYGFSIENNDGEEIDSCWGFFGYDDMIKDCKGTIDSIIKG